MKTIDDLNTAIKWAKEQQKNEDDPDKWQVLDELLDILEESNSELNKYENLRDDLRELSNDLERLLP